MAVIDLHKHAHAHARYLIVISILQKLTVPLLVKKFAAFYGTRIFITVTIRARLRSLFRDRWIKFQPSQICFSRICYYLPNHAQVSYVFFFSSDFPVKIYGISIFLACHVRHMLHPSYLSHCDNPNFMMIIITNFSPSCYRLCPCKDTVSAPYIVM